MSLIHRVRERVARVVRKREVLRIAGQLRNRNVPAVSALARTLERSVSAELAPEEERWLCSVEEIRERLLCSTEEIQFVDFGAGQRDRLKSSQPVTRVVGEVCKSASKPRRWAGVLFHLVREFRPVSCVELGTCLGISGMYQAAALRLNGQGKLATLEGSEGFARIAMEGLQTLHLDNVEVSVGRFEDTLPGVLQSSRPIDFAFIDGHHEERATIDYFNQFLPNLASSALLVFDDIDWSDGMKRAWAAIQAEERVRFSLDLQQMGVCLIDSTIPKRSVVKVKLP